jgi:hypothetical protein
MVNNLKNLIKENWKFIVWGLAPIAILAIIFALPIKTVPVQATETYWDTEMKSQPYTVSESYTDAEPYTATETRTETVYDSYAYLSGWSHTFKIGKPDSTVSINIQSYYYPYVYSITCPTYPDDETRCRTWPYFYDYGGGQGKVTIKVSYPEEVTKYRTVTKSRDVTKYREVPTQVLKERAVTKYVKMSIWSYLFR